MMDANQVDTAKALYDAIRSERDIYMQRARRSAALTLPYMIDLYDDFGPGNTALKTQEHPLPWNGKGQQGVNNLASHLMFTQLPPTEPNFRFMFDEVELAQEKARMTQEGATEEQVAEKVAENESNMSKLERQMLRDIEARSDRVVVLESFLHLVIGGNCLLYDSPKALRVFHLNRYVLERTPEGTPARAVILESVPIETLPKDVQALLEKEQQPRQEGDRAPRYQDVYTEVRWNYGGSTVYWQQEAKGHKFGRMGEAPIDRSPWIPLRLFRIEGQAYAPGYVEAVVLADLNTAEALSQAVAEGSLLISQQKNGVSPTSVSSARTWAEAGSGAYVPARPEDVFPVPTGNVQGLQVAQASLTVIEARIAAAFLMPQIRESERTTAEEVRLQIQQIEKAQGAIYSILTVEFLLPYVNRRLSQTMAAKGIPPLPPGLVKPVPCVGLAAVGRGNELQRTMQFMQAGAATLGPEQFLQRINPSELMTRLATQMGLDTEGLIRSNEEVAAEQAQAQQAMQMQQLMQNSQKLAGAAATVQEMQQPATEQPAPTP